MPEKSQLLYLTDAQGQVRAVQISWELWQQMRPLVDSLISSNVESEPRKQAQQPLRDFEEFLRYWDFRYPYAPAVRCPQCGAATEDWRVDSGQPFLLTNASLGGLLVFHCMACGTTIRQKHFRDHVALEHSPSVT